MGTTKLYVAPGSHPSLTAQLGLELKGIPFKRVDLISGVHVIPQQLRFGSRTPKSAKAADFQGVQFADGEKVVGSMAVLRALERRVPEPPLFPADPEERARVEAAEAWGESVLQPVPRQLIYSDAARRVPADALLSYASESKLPLPLWAAKPFLPVITRVEKRLNAATQDTARRHLKDLNRTLDVVDGYLADGTIGGEHPNAADLQIVTSVRLLMTIDDLAPVIEAGVATWTIPLSVSVRLGNETIAPREPSPSPAVPSRRQARSRPPSTATR